MRTEYTPRLTPDVGPDDHLRGNANAPVTLVEYGDFQCPYCGMAYRIVRELERRSGGALRVVFRNFPLSTIHPQAEGAAEAAEAAAAQGKFWEMHDLIYEHQDRIHRGDLEQYAERIGLDLPGFRDDLDTRRWLDTVKAQFHGGVLSGVNGTPTFFINGRRHDGGYELEELLVAVGRAANGASARGE